MADAALSPSSSDLEQLLQQELAALSSRSASLCSSGESSQVWPVELGPSVTDSTEWVPSAAFQALQHALLKREQLCEQVVKTLAEVQQQLDIAPPNGTADSASVDAAAAAVLYYAEHSTPPEEERAAGGQPGGCTAVDAEQASGVQASAASAEVQPVLWANSNAADHAPAPVTAAAAGTSADASVPPAPPPDQQQQGPCAPPQQDTPAQLPQSAAAAAVVAAGLLTAAAAGDTEHPGPEQIPLASPAADSGPQTAALSVPAARGSSASDCRSSLELDQAWPSFQQSPEHAAATSAAAAAGAVLVSGLPKAEGSMQQQQQQQQQQLGSTSSSTSIHGSGIRSSVEASSCSPQPKLPVIGGDKSGVQSSCRLQAESSQMALLPALSVAEDTATAADQGAALHGLEHRNSIDTATAVAGAVDAVPSAVAASTTAAGALAPDNFAAHSAVASAEEAHLQQLEQRKQQLQAAMAAEREAELAATQELQLQKQQLEKQLQQQAEAAAQRGLQLQEATRKLQQQVEQRARRHMAAWKISSAWSRYQCSSRRAEKLEQLTCLQAAVRGWLVRRQLQQQAQQQGLLQQLELALQAGDAQQVEEARTAAEAAGLASDVQQMVQRVSLAAAAAEDKLRAAAAGDSYAAYTSAAAAAGRYSAVATTVSECAAAFASRQDALMVQIAAAAAAAPVGDLEVLLQKGLELGLSQQQLRSARESARDRDRQLVAELAAYARATDFVHDVWQGLMNRGAKLGLTIEVELASKELTKRRERTTQLLQTAVEQLQVAWQQQQQLLVAPQPPQQPCSDLRHLQQQVQSALAEARQLGLQQEAVSAHAILHQRQQQLLEAARLAAAAGTWEDAQQKLAAAAALGINKQELQQAQEQLQRRQQQAEQELKAVVVHGTYTEVLAALASAQQLAVADTEQVLTSFQQRQSTAAGRLVDAAEACCQSVGMLSSVQLKQLQQAAQQDEQATAAATGASSTVSSAISQVVRSAEVPAVAGAALQQLHQQLALSWGLGLKANVQAVLAALRLRCHQLLSQGGTVIASRALPLETCSFAGEYAWLSGTSPELPTVGSSEAAAGDGSHYDSYIAADAGEVECALPEHYVLPAAATATASVNAVWDFNKALEVQEQEWQAEQQQHRYLQQLRQQLLKEDQQQQEPCSAAGSSSSRPGHIGAGSRAADCRLTPSMVQVEDLICLWQQQQQQRQQQKPQTCPGSTAATGKHSNQVEGSSSSSSSNTVGKGITEALIRGIVGPGTNLQQLCSLDLSLEQLSSTDTLAAVCPQLQVLRLSSNRLAQLQGLEQLRQLKELHLQDNQLQCWPALPSQHLTKLSLANNSLAALVHLQPSLALSSHSSTGSSSSTITTTSKHSSSSSADGGSSQAHSYPVLQSLDLSSNRLVDLHGMPQCGQLLQLRLHGNHLTSLQGLQACCCLQQLHLANNRLTSFPATSTQLHLPLLQHLDLSHNRLTALPDFSACLMPHLTALHLSHNLIEGLGPFLSCHQLQLLDLTFNSIAGLEQLQHLQLLLAMRTLLLSDNPVSSSRPQLYRAAVAHSLPLLWSLDLEDGWQQQQQLVRQHHPWQQHIEQQQQLVWQRQPQQQHLEQQQQQQEEDVVGPAAAAVVRASAPAAAMAVRYLQHQQLRCPASHTASLQQAVALRVLPALLNSCPDGFGRGCHSSPATLPPAAAAANGSELACSIRQQQQQDQLPAWLHQQQQQWLYSALHHLVQQQALEQAVCRPLLTLCSVSSKPALSSCSAAAQLSSPGAAAGDLLQEQLPYWLASWLQRCGCSIADVSTAAAALLEQAVGSSSSSSSSSGDTGSCGAPIGAACSSNAPLLAAAVDAAAFPGALAQQHLQQLQQPLVRNLCKLQVRRSYHLHQQQLHTAAATVLQRSWRCRAANQALAGAREQQQLQQAAVLLQCCWRGRALRRGPLLVQLRAGAAARQQAAATIIQAVVRGQAVRRRLAAALCAARGPTKQQQGEGQQQQLGATAAAGPDLDMLDDPEGVTEVWWEMPEHLFKSAPLAPGAAAAAAKDVSHSRVAPPHQKIAQASPPTAAAAVAVPVAAAARTQGDLSSPSATAAAEPDAAAPSAEPSCAAEASCDTLGGTAAGSTYGGDPGRRTAYLAKLHALMQEWGFKDLATAEAHFKRQRHVTQHARKAKQAQQLRDPQERLKRLQRQVAARGNPLQPSHHAAQAPHPTQQQQQHGAAGRVAVQTGQQCDGPSFNATGGNSSSSSSRGPSCGGSVLPPIAKAAAGAAPLQATAAQGGRLRQGAAGGMADRRSSSGNGNSAGGLLPAIHGAARSNLGC